MATRSRPGPRARLETVRQAIVRCLEEGPQTAHELSARVHVREREIVPHLEHLERSLRRVGRRLVCTPPECLACGYAFPRRRRLTRPGACPECRGRRIAPPVFHVESGRPRRGIERQGDG